MANRPAPYLRIAADIERRVSNGELAPGARVASTRSLAKRWGVSLATASKALRALVHEGVLVATPRVGMTVARPARSGSRPRETELSRERIVRAAIEIADAEGLTALSIRGVASKIGAPVMSLYRHVPNKEELLGLMSEIALAEEPLPAETPASWRTVLETGARAYWRIYHRHPWLARVITILRPLPLPASIERAEWVFRGLRAQGLDAATTMHMHVTLYAFLQGLAVNLEAEAEAEEQTGVDDETWMESKQDAYEALARSGRFPAFAAIMHELSSGFDLPMDAVFEHGLTTLLDGFATTIEKSGRAR